MASRHVYPFEKLRVWGAARQLTVDTYSATRIFPRTEIYRLASQINRAVVSVAANLAEESARTSRKDQAHFSQIAYGSLMELACLFILAVDLGFLAAAKESSLREQIESVSRQINARRSAQISL